MQPTSELLTTTEAADIATRWRRLLSAGSAAITPAAIRQWRARGHLQPAGLDEHRRPLYRRSDIALAEAATRGRALRLAGIPQAKGA